MPSILTIAMIAYIKVRAGHKLSALHQTQYHDFHKYSGKFITSKPTTQFYRLESRSNFHQFKQNQKTSTNTHSYAIDWNIFEQTIFFLGESKRLWDRKIYSVSFDLISSVIILWKIVFTTSTTVNQQHWLHQKMRLHSKTYNGSSNAQNRVSVQYHL